MRQVAQCILPKQQAARVLLQIERTPCFGGCAISLGLIAARRRISIERLDPNLSLVTGAVPRRSRHPNGTGLFRSTLKAANTSAPPPAGCAQTGHGRPLWKTSSARCSAPSRYRWSAVSADFPGTFRGQRLDARVPFVAAASRKGRRAWAVAGILRQLTASRQTVRWLEVAWEQGRLSGTVSPLERLQCGRLSAHRILLDIRTSLGRLAEDCARFCDSEAGFGVRTVVKLWPATVDEGFPPSR